MLLPYNFYIFWHRRLADLGIVVEGRYMKIIRKQQILVSNPRIFKSLSSILTFNNLVKLQFSPNVAEVDGVNGCRGGVYFKTTGLGTGSTFKVLEEFWTLLVTGNIIYSTGTVEVFVNLLYI